MFEDIMIDNESMGLAPEGALVSIGAVFFNAKEGKLGPAFYRSISLATSVDAGMKMDAATVMWWMGQSDAARQAMQYNAIPLKVALLELAEFLRGHVAMDAVRPWGNSSGFDLAMLTHAHKLCGLALPWKFWNERCFRTVRAMYPKVEYDLSKKEGTAHNALDDAKFQARHLIKIADAYRS